MFRLITVLILSFSSVDLFASDPDCQSDPSVVHELAKISAKIEEQGRDPRKYFYSACRGSGVSKGKNVKDRKEEIISYIRLLIKERRDQYEKKLSLVRSIKNCTQNNEFKTDPSCEVVSNWLQTDFQAAVSNARTALSLGHVQGESSYSSSDYCNKDRLQLNNSLDTFESFKPTPWEKLSADEVKRSEFLFAKMQKKSKISKIPQFRISDMCDKREARNTPMPKVVRDFAQMRASFYVSYLFMVTSNPLLLYVKSAHPTADEIHKASGEMLSDLNKEDLLIRKFQENLNSSIESRDKLDQFLPEMLKKNDFIKILNDRSMVNNFLIKNPEYCGIALSLEQIKEQNDSRSQMQGLVTSGLGMAGYFVFPLAAAGLTEAYSAFELVSSYDEIEAQKGLLISKSGALGSEKTTQEIFSQLIDNLNNQDKNTELINRLMSDEVQRPVENLIYVSNTEGELKNTTNVMLMAPFVSAGLIKVKSILSKKWPKAKSE